MRGVVVPEPTEDYSADPVELFFDLAFVFAFSQLVQLLIHHPDWDGIGQAALLFLLLWMPWSQFTWSANAVPGNQRSVRIAFLVATVASVPMAAAVQTALNGGGALFAIPLSVIHILGIALMLTGLEPGSKEFNSSLRYAVPNILAMLVLLVGGFLADGARVGAWVASLLIFAYATIRAGEGEWIIRVGHFAERHGLIIIVALGEVIVALGNAVVTPLNEGDGFEAAAVVALVATGVCATLLWWAYFDRVQPALEHRAEKTAGNERGRFARDVYTYAHLPIVAGIIFIAAGLEHAALHPGDELPLAFRLMLLGGLAMFLGGIGLGVFRSFGVVAVERLVALAALAVVFGIDLGLDGVVLIVALDVVLLTMLAFEHERIELRPARAERTGASAP